jgi:hypothetical protein
VKSFGIAVNVSDGSVTSTGTLTVGIEDDSPVIGTPASASLYNGAGTLAEGDLHLQIGADSGSGAKAVFAGTSVDASGFITANRVDQAGTVVGSGFLTYNGSKLHYVSGSDGSLSAVDTANTTVYTVSGDIASGHYDVAMLHALDPVQVTTGRLRQRQRRQQRHVFVLGRQQHLRSVGHRLRVERHPLDGQHQRQRFRRRQQLRRRQREAGVRHQRPRLGKPVAS